MSLRTLELVRIARWLMVVAITLCAAPSWVGAQTDESASSEPGSESSQEPPSFVITETVPVPSSNEDGYPTALDRQSLSLIEPDRKPPRITLAMQTVDLALHALGGGSLLAAANDNDPGSLFENDQRVLRIAAGVHFTFAAVNLYGMVQSGIELSRRKQSGAASTSLTYPRAGTAVSAISMTYWYWAGVTSFALLSREDADGDEGVLIGGAIFNLAIAGMHTWALVRNLKDLRSTKERRARKQQPVARTGPRFTGNGVLW